MNYNDHFIQYSNSQLPRGTISYNPEMNSDSKYTAMDNNLVGFGNYSHLYQHSYPDNRPLEYTKASINPKYTESQKHYLNSLKYPNNNCNMLPTNHSSHIEYDNSSAAKLMNSYQQIQTPRVSSEHLRRLYSNQCHSNYNQNVPSIPNSNLFNIDDYLMKIYSQLSRDNIMKNQNSCNNNERYRSTKTNQIKPETQKHSNMSAVIKQQVPLSSDSLVNQHFNQCILKEFIKNQNNPNVQHQESSTHQPSQQTNHFVWTRGGVKSKSSNSDTLIRPESNGLVERQKLNGYQNLDKRKSRFTDSDLPLKKRFIQIESCLPTEVSDVSSYQYNVPGLRPSKPCKNNINNSPPNSCSYIDPINYPQSNGSKCSSLSDYKEDILVIDTDQMADKHQII